MPEKELAELVEDIVGYGFREPIVLYEGMILTAASRCTAGVAAFSWAKQWP